MLTRVETLKRNGTQQANYFHNFDQRLQRLEDMQASTLQLLNVLAQNMQTTTFTKQTMIDTDVTETSANLLKDNDDNEYRQTTGASTPDEVPMGMSSLLSSTASSTLRASNFNNRKGNNTLSMGGSTQPQIMVNAYTELLAMKGSVSSTLPSSDERLGIGGSAPLYASSSSLNVPDDTSHKNLYKAEETEHNIYGKLIKERFRKLSEVVEDIERTLPSHQQRHDCKHDKCDIIDDDETLSTLDWVDTGAGRVAFNSTRVSRFDVNQDEMGSNFIATGKSNGRLFIRTAVVCLRIFIYF
jgi:hypothetical protein